MGEKLVTVAKFANSFEAHMAKLRLDANGIDAFIIGENFANMCPLPQLSFVEVQVPADKAKEAEEILQSKKQEQ